MLATKRGYSMNNKKIRRFDVKGRIIVPRDMMKFLGITEKTQLAICSWKENEITIKKIEECKDCEVLSFTKIDRQGRINIPKNIRGGDIEVEIFLVNGGLILRGTH